jgi:hypothetical protein
MIKRLTLISCKRIIQGSLEKIIQLLFVDLVRRADGHTWINIKKTFFLATVVEAK